MTRINNLKERGFDKHPEHINTKGRPKGKSLTTLLKEKLDGENYLNLKDCELLKNGKPTGEKVDVRVSIPTKEQIINAALKRAIKDQKTMEYIIDRIEGKPKQNIELNEDTEIHISYSDIFENE